MIDFENLAQAMGELDEDTVKELLEQVMAEGGADAGNAVQPLGIQSEKPLNGEKSQLPGKADHVRKPGVLHGIPPAEQELHLRSVFPEPCCKSSGVIHGPVRVHPADSAVIGKQTVPAPIGTGNAEVHHIDGNGLHSSPLMLMLTPLTSTLSSAQMRMYLTPPMTLVSIRSDRSGLTLMVTSGVLISNFF